MILDDKGFPTPPQEIVQSIRRVDPSLGMRYGSVGGNGGIWYYTERWREDDPRRESIKKGEINPDFDFDVIGSAPLETSAEEAYHYLVRSLKQRPQTKSDYSSMLERVTNYNAAQTRENMRETTDLAEELVETNAKTLWRNEGKHIPKVYQNTGRKYR